LRRGRKDGVLSANNNVVGTKMKKKRARGGSNRRKGRQTPGTLVHDRGDPAAQRSAQRLRWSLRKRS